MAKFTTYTFLVLLLLGYQANSVSANFLGAFWLGVDAKVETNISVDQSILDTVNNLPQKIREEFVKAANASIDKLDTAVERNIRIAAEQAILVSLRASLDWECTFGNVADRAITEIKSGLPRFKIFMSRCEKDAKPDDVGIGHIEKINISQCLVYDVLDTKTSPEIIAPKIANLELLSYDAACRLRQTSAASGMMLTKAQFGQRYLTWQALQGICQNANDCLPYRLDKVGKLISENEERDTLEARSIVSGIDTIACGLQCMEHKLVKLFEAENSIIRNRKTRTTTANTNGKKAISELEIAIGLLPAVIQEGQSIKIVKMFNFKKYFDALAKFESAISSAKTLHGVALSYDEQYDGKDTFTTSLSNVSKRFEDAQKWIQPKLDKISVLTKRHQENNPCLFGPVSACTATGGIMR